MTMMLTTCSLQQELSLEEIAEQMERSDDELSMAPTSPRRLTLQLKIRSSQDKPDLLFYLDQLILPYWLLLKFFLLTVNLPSSTSMSQSSPENLQSWQLLRQHLPMLWHLKLLCLM